MLTINQTLSPADGLLGHWSLWSNDILSRLDTLRITPKAHVSVEYIKTLHISSNGKTWLCEHASTHTERVECYDEYLEAVTGIPQGLTYQTITFCDTCPATHDGTEWTND